MIVRCSAIQPVILVMAGLCWTAPANAATEPSPGKARTADSRGVAGKTGEQEARDSGVMELRKDLPELAKKLGDADFATREKAQQEIQAEGKVNPSALIDFLKATWLAKDDPEVRTRCEAIIRELIVVRGFLGIHMLDSRLAAERGAVPQNDAEALKPGRVVVGQIEPESPAEKAGFKTGDIILGSDGKPLAEESPLLDLTARIQRKFPGSAMEFSVLRDAQPLSIKARLGRIELTDPRIRRGYMEMEEEIKRQETTFNSIISELQEKDGSH